VQFSSVVCGHYCAHSLIAQCLMFQAKPAESLSEYAHLVSVSPSRHYFMVVFICIIGAIFIGGLLFGRVTKRVKREMKSK
jgi:hypothetical protein